jgi:CheY-like chemotaxis protein
MNLALLNDRPVLSRGGVYLRSVFVKDASKSETTLHQVHCKRFLTMTTWRGTLTPDRKIGKIGSWNRVLSYYVRKSPTSKMAVVVMSLMREILLVEDCDPDAALVERALNLLSVANRVRRVITAQDAIAHLDRAATAAAIGPPTTSILILDLALPDMSGLRVLEHMLGRPEFSKTLRIVLSNINHAKTIQRAYDLGAHTFLTKPVQPADMLDLIESFPGYWSFTAKIENPFKRLRKTMAHG